jgi:hypothetical protein
LLDTRALRRIFAVNDRAMFEWLISPLSVAEVANVQDFADRERRVRWILEVLDHWLIMLDSGCGSRTRTSTAWRYEPAVPGHAEAWTLKELNRLPPL